MKSKSIIIWVGGMLLVSTILIIGAVSFFGQPQAPMTKSDEQQDAQSQDLLSEANLIPLINNARTASGLSALIPDATLTQEANMLSQSSGSTNAPTTVVPGKIITHYTVLSGSYYSSKGLMSSWIADPAYTSVLLGQGTKIGVWVSYIVPSKDAAPVPWIVVLIQ